MSLRFVLISVLIVDFVVRLASPYVTGCTRAPGTPEYTFPDCGVVLIPYTAVLRPVLLMVRSKDLRETISMFMQTIVASKKVLYLKLAIFYGGRCFLLCICQTFGLYRL